MSHHAPATYLTDGAALTPIGAAPPDRVTRTVLGLDRVIAVDDFDRPNTTSGLGNCVTGQPWQNSGQPLRVVDSHARNPASGGLGVAWLETRNPHVTVEADLWWTGTSNVGMVLRWKDANNHFCYVAEDNGAMLRFYVRNSGTLYNLAQAGSAPITGGMWHRYAASIRGNRFLGFLDDQIVIAYTISEIDTNLLAGDTKHGLQMTSAAGAEHHCRRFVVST